MKRRRKEEGSDEERVGPSGRCASVYACIGGEGEMEWGEVRRGRGTEPRGKKRGEGGAAAAGRGKEAGAGRVEEGAACRGERIGAAAARAPATTTRSRACISRNDFYPLFEIFPSRFLVARGKFRGQNLTPQNRSSAILNPIRN